MPKPWFLAWMISVGLMALGVGTVSSQNYPNKPIRIVTSAVGGANDFTSRLIAQGISGPLGQPVIVDNRGIIAFELVAKASPDGYTVLLHGPPLWVGPLLQKTPYDPVRDFAPITLLASSPNIVVVNPSVPARSVKELIALAKTKPGELNYASASRGGSTHLAAELFTSMAGVNIVRIPYKGSGPALNGLIGGEAQVMFSTAGGVVPHIKSGKLRALAVTSAQPSALFPDLPTVAATVPGYESDVIYGVFAPAKTPAVLINRLNQEIVRVLNRPDIKGQLFNAGVEVVASSPEQLAAAVKADMARMGKVIKDAGIRAD